MYSILGIKKNAKRRVLKNFAVQANRFSSQPVILGLLCCKDYVIDVINKIRFFQDLFWSRVLSVCFLQKASKLGEGAIFCKKTHPQEKHRIEIKSD